MPLLSKLLFFGVLFFLPVLSYAQDDSYILKGQLMVKGGDSYKYELVFTSNKGIVSGYSLTYLGGAAPSKARITGVIDKDKKTFAFRETKVLNGDKEQTMCLVSCKLSYSQGKGKFVFLGTFKGKDIHNVACGDGVVAFTHTARKDKLFGADTVKNGPQLAHVETVTEGVKRELKTTADSCIVDVWDYGVQDGDIITVLYNGQVVLANYELTAEKKHLRLPLTNAENMLTIRAENEGRVPPNTARVMVHEGDATHEFTAYNEEGKEATIVLRKK